MSKVSIIIPTYFNQKSISALKEDMLELKSKIKKENIDLQIIFIDDDSKDDTFEIIKENFLDIEDVILLKNSKNIGSWKSIKSALKYVNGDAFMFLAADRQDPIEVVSQLIFEWKKGENIVIAERKNRVDTFMSKAFANLFLFIVRNFFFEKFPKNGFDISIIDSKYLEFFRQSSGNYYIPFHIFWLGLKPKSIEYIREKRDYGKSRFTFKKKLDLVFDSFFSYSKIPVRIFIYIGFFVSFLSFLYGINSIIFKLIYGNPVPGFTTIVVMLSFFSGILICGLGLLLEFVSRIYTKNQNTNESVIIEIIRTKEEDNL